MEAKCQPKKHREQQHNFHLRQTRSPRASTKSTESWLEREHSGTKVNLNWCSYYLESFLKVLSNLFCLREMSIFLIHKSNHTILWCSETRCELCKFYSKKSIVRHLFSSCAYYEGKSTFNREFSKEIHQK